MNLENQILTYINEHEQFKEILRKLRTLILEHDFEETIKWGIPTYTYGGKNQVGIAGFKNHVGLWFFQGAVLKDDKKILHNAQEGKTKALRQVHFTHLDEIDDQTLREYFIETIQNHNKGLRIEFKKKPIQVRIPDELTAILDSNTALKEAFESLTPGKRKEYAAYISSAKREETKTKRMEKITPLILAGKGLNDKYKSKN